MPGGDAGRRPDVAVAHEDRVGVDLDVGVAARELGAGGPVRRRAAAVEQAGLGEQEGAGADRGDPARAPRPPRRTSARAPGLGAAVRHAAPPATSSVSIGRGGGRRERSGWSRMPLVLARTALPPVAVTISTV